MSRTGQRRFRIVGSVPLVEALRRLVHTTTIALSRANSERNLPSSRKNLELCVPLDILTEHIAPSLRNRTTRQRVGVDVKSIDSARRRLANRSHRVLTGLNPGQIPKW